MKQLFTLICVLLITHAYSQTTFRIGVDALKYDLFYGIVQLDDGSYIVTGSANDDFYIAKFNPQGQLLSSKHIFETDRDFSEGVAIIKTSDGNIAVSGTLNYQIVVLKFDINLNILWNKKYTTTTAYGYGLRLLQTSEGGYMITGYQQNSDTLSGGAFDGAGFIMKITSDGSLSWMKRYFEFINYESIIYDIVSTQDGNYVFLADSYGDGSVTFDTTFLVKINGNGDVIWSKYVTDTSYNISSITLHSATDGGFAVCGSIANIDSSTSENDRAMLLKFSENGNLVWAKACNNAEGDNSIFWGIMQDNDGNYIGSGYIESNISFADKPYLVKINTNGAVQWTKTYPDINISSYFFKTLRTNDGGYIASGEAYNESDNTDFCALYKFDSDFNICGTVEPYGTFTNLNLASNTINLSVYNETVNPVTNNYTVAAVGTVANLCVVLPIQLLSFNATLQNKTVSIQWKTANEINTDYFIVERSSNSTAFQTVQQVKAAGNSNATQTYQITDVQPLPGTSYYRLKGVDKDGSVTYSSIASVTVNTNGTIIISPNPVQQNLHIQLQSTSSNKATIQITDVTGKILSTQQTTITTGANNITLPAASLSKGMYLLKVIQNNKTQAVKFVKE